MVLHYTISDTQLAEASMVKRIKLAPDNRHRRYSRNRKIAFLTLTVVNVIIWTFVYEICPKKEPPIADFSQTTTTLGPVTGIMYSKDKPSAIIRGKAVYQGDIVDGFKILKIGRREVIFEKDGRAISKQVSVSKRK